MLLCISDFWTNDWVIEIVGGIFTSILLFVILIAVKPRIAISEFIIKHEAKDNNGKLIKDEKGNQKYEYKIKVINKSWFTVIDVKYKLYIVKGVSAPKGENALITPILLKSDKSDFIPSRYSKHAKRFNLFAEQKGVENDLIKSWTEVGTENSFLRFEVMAKHPLSGVVKVFIEDYSHFDTCLKSGYFESGNSFEFKEKSS